MVPALTRLAALILLLAGTAVGHAQPLFSGTELPGSRQATAQDIINALNAAKAAVANPVNQTYTNPLFNLDGTARLASQWLGTARQADKAVMVGGVTAGYALLAQLAPTDRLLTDGRIGLYQHANGNASLTAAQRAALWHTWSGTGVTPSGQGQSVAEIGEYASAVPAGYLGFFGGAYPSEAAMNVATGTGAGTASYTAVTGDAHPGQVYGGYMGAADLALFESAVSAANTAGARNIVAYVTPNGGNEDLDDPFATSPFWANVRAAALFSGGLGLDAPPSYLLARAPNYRAMVIQMIQWSVANGLRVIYLISPYATVPDSAYHTGGCGYDLEFFENTRTVMGLLQAARALPTQFGVENYGAPGPQCGTENDWQLSDDAPESLNVVALYVADTVPTAPTGTTPAGSNGVAEAGLESPASLVPVLAPSLSAGHVGQLRLLDFVGWGSMASQSSDNIDVTGGILSGVTLNNPTINAFTSTGQAFLSGGDIVGGAHVIQGPGGAVAMDMNAAGTLSIAAPGGLDTMVKVYGSLLADNVGVSGAPISSGLFTNLRTSGQAFFVGGDIVQGFHVVQGPGGAVAMDLNTKGTLTVAMPGGAPATLNVLQGTILAANMGSDASPIAVSYLTNLNVFGATAFMNGLINFPVSGVGAVATVRPTIPGRLWADPANDYTLKLSQPAA